MRKVFLSKIRSLVTISCIAIMLVGLTACGNENGSDITPTNEPTTAATSKLNSNITPTTTPVPTATLTPTPLVLPTATPEPTSKPEPTSTPTPTPTNTPKPTNTPTPTPVPFDYSKVFTYEAKDDGTLKITGLTDEYENDYSKKFVVPETINGATVTAIDDNCFYYLVLTSLSLPNTLTEIGENAFSYCSLSKKLFVPKNVTFIGNGALNFNYLQSIEVDPDNTKYTSKDGILYTKDMSSLLCVPSGYNFSEGIFHVPEGVVTIESDSICNNYSVNEIFLPKSIKTVQDYSLTYSSEENFPIVTIHVPVSIISFNMINSYNNIIVVTSPGTVAEESTIMNDYMIALHEDTSFRLIDNECSAIANASIGESVYFGSYEYDKEPSIYSDPVLQQVFNTDGADPIHWFVIKREGNRVLLLSKYELDAIKFITTDATITWETWEVRKWLNDTFYNAAFTKEEKALICDTVNINHDNPQSGAEGGIDTTDKVFLLSIEEAEQLSESIRISYPTPYARSNGAGRKDSMSGFGPWWLRTPDIDGTGMTYVYTENGQINYEGDASSEIRINGNEMCTIRPAIWIAVE